MMHARGRRARAQGRVGTRPGVVRAQACPGARGEGADELGGVGLGGRAFASPVRLAVAVL